MDGMRSCCTRQQQKIYIGAGDPGNEETRADSLYSSRIPCVLQRFYTGWATWRGVGGKGIDTQDV